MLSSDQLAQLAAAIVATAETLGQAISAAAAEMMADDLAGYDQAPIAEALRACRRELTGKLTLAAILQRIQGADGRPEPNEAWAIALESFDEASTVLVTPEIQQAAAAALPIFLARDKVGARMAFIAAYERVVRAARAAGQPLSWSLSLGHDPQGRVLAIQEAQRLGRLLAPTAALLLAQHSPEPVTTDGHAIAGLLTGNGAAPSPELQARWRQVKAGLETHKRRKAIQARWDARCERRRFAAHKAAQLAALVALQSKELTP